MNHETYQKTHAWAAPLNPWIPLLLLRSETLSLHTRRAGAESRVVRVSEFPQWLDTWKELYIVARTSQRHLRHLASAWGIDDDTRIVTGYISDCESLGQEPNYFLNYELSIKLIIVITSSPSAWFCKKHLHPRPKKNFCFDQSLHAETW